MKPDIHPLTRDLRQTADFHPTPALHATHNSVDCPAPVDRPTGVTQSNLAHVLAALTCPAPSHNLLAPLLARWAASCTDISPVTTKERGRVLARWAKWLTAEKLEYWDKLRPDHVQKYIQEIRQTSGQNRAVITLSAIKQFLRWATAGGAPATADKSKSPQQPDDLTRMLTPGEAAQLCAAPGPVYMRLAVWLGYGSGCRAGEIAGLQIAAIDWQKNTAVITGKGEKKRIIHLNPQTVKLMHRYMADERSRAATPHSPGTMLLTRDGHAATNDTINDWVKRQAGRASISRRITSHMLRHSFATRLIESGTSYEIISRLLGHSSQAVTRRYTHLSPEYLQAQIAAAHPAWQKEGGK